MHSFDVFDTLITRCVAEPKGIFMLMREILRRSDKYDPFLCENFYELRVGAEELARLYALSHGRQEITLDDIYCALSTTTHVSDTQQKELSELEIEVECSQVIGIKKNIDLLKELKDHGNHVVLISDMYLDENVIRRMLCLIDTVFADIPIYVSSVYGKTKESGELFKVVQKKEKINFSNWTHYGDNESSDIRSALKNGIRAVHLVSEGLKEYEAPKKDIYHQISVGISRYIRLTYTSNTAMEVGCSLAGPILYSYVSWVLRESIDRGINRLYFVARDGWILRQIADIIIQIRKYPIKTYYIYGSRKAWRMPSYKGLKEDFDRILYLSNLEKINSLEDLAKLFQIRLDEMKQFLPDSYGIISAEQMIGSVQKSTLCQWLRENPSFREFLVKKQAINRRLVLRYLQQEMDISDDRFAFVELAGSGLTQKCLAQIIRDFYTGKIRNFYFKRDSLDKEEHCHFINFYPSNMKLSCMVELLCRAPHGQTEGYMEADGQILPVLEQTEGQRIKAYHLEDYQNGVLAYVKLMENTHIKNRITFNERLDIVREYMDVIAKNPPERIAEYFCHMPFSDDGRKNAVMEFAPPITHKQLRRIFFWENEENIHQIYNGSSLEYALTVSDHAVKYAEKCRKYKQTNIGKWLVGWNRYLHTHQKPGSAYFCPWEFLEGNIVIYGAGRVGQAYVKQAKQRCSRCDRLLWVDSNYMDLQNLGLEVRSPENIKGQAFDRVIIAIHSDTARQEIWDKLREMGVEAEKIYYG